MLSNTARRIEIFAAPQPGQRVKMHRRICERCTGSSSGSGHEKSREKEHTMHEIHRHKNTAVLQPTALMAANGNSNNTYKNASKASDTNTSHRQQGDPSGRSLSSTRTRTEKQNQSPLLDEPNKRHSLFSPQRHKVATNRTNPTAAPHLSLSSTRQYTENPFTRASLWTCSTESNERKQIIETER